MVELRPPRHLTARSYRCGDSVACTTAIQRRPNKSELRTNSFVVRVGGDSRIDFELSNSFPKPSAQSKVRYARPPLSKQSASHVESRAAFSFDEPHPARTDQPSQGGDQLDKENGQVAHGRMVAGREILRINGRNNNSPGTSTRKGCSWNLIRIPFLRSSPSRSDSS